MPLRRKQIIFTIVLAILVTILFVSFVLPLIVRRELEKGITAETDRVCTVAKVRINPLLLNFEVDDLKLLERGEKAEFFTLGRLKFHLSPASIWRMAPVLSGLILTSPSLHIKRDAPNHYNFTDILEKQAKKKKPEGKPARFSLNNIQLVGGKVEFQDIVDGKEQKHVVDKIALSIPFISNISYFAEQYINPNFSALVNGSPFEFKGKLKPFEKGLEASVDIDIKDLDIPYYAAYFPKALPVVVKNGRLSADIKVRHHLVREGKSDINLSGSSSLDDIELQMLAGGELLSFKKLEVVLKNIALLNRKYEVDSLRLSSPQMLLAGDKDGVWNLQKLSAKSEDPAKKAEPDTKSNAESVDFSFALVEISDGLVKIRDEHPVGGFKTDLKELTLKVENLASKGEAPASCTLSLLTSRGEKGTLVGQLLLEPLNVSSRIGFGGVLLDAYHPYMAATLNEPLKGKGDLVADILFSMEKGLRVENASLDLKGVKIPFGKVDGVDFPLINLAGGNLNLKERSFSLKHVNFNGGTVKLSRDGQGTLSSSLLVKNKPADSGSTVSATAKAGEKPFVWSIDRLGGKGIKFTFTDNLKEGAPKFDVSGINFSMSPLTGPKFSEMQSSLQLAYGGGTLDLNGRLTPAPFKYRGDLVFSAIPIADVDPYLPAGVNLTLQDGTVDAKSFLDIWVKDGKLLGSFQGEAGVRDFYVTDADDADLLKWKSIFFEKFNGNIDPLALSIKGVSLNDYFAKIIVGKNGKLNLQELYTPPKIDLPAKSGAETVARKNRDIRVDTVTLSNGSLEFSDLHLKRLFSTNMLNMGGRVSGLSSDPASTADIDLRGNLESHSPLRISGKINPLANDLILDMAILFSDIELSPLTPYSGTYLGYVIDKGKLSLSLNYKIVKKDLISSNKIFIDQFTFGEAVESEKATALPVRFAVALLKDKNGEIHLDLPVAGRTDAPEFSIWGMVGQMLKNLLVKAATSPMALLRASIGGSEDFSSIVFESGSSRLAQPEEEKLRSLAKALAQRPGLRLEVTGFVDREHDPEGYRRETLARKLKTEQVLYLTKEKRSAVNTVLTKEEQSKILKNVYEKEKFPKPRTAIGTLKSLPDEEMKKLILTNTQVTEENLRALARERGVQVMSFLVGEGGVSQERIFEKSGDPFSLPQGGESAASRVEFGIIAK